MSKRVFFVIGIWPPWQNDRVRILFDKFYDFKICSPVLSQISPNNKVLHKWLALQSVALRQTTANDDSAIGRSVRRSSGRRSGGRLLAMT